MEEGSVEVKECAFKDILDTCNDTKKFDTKTLFAEQFTKIEECSGKLMSFVGCIGKLMSNSGLEKVMKVAFAGVEKMLIGKKFPMNVRALRIVSLELL